MGKFQKALDEALARESEHIRQCLKESARPSEGIWYWVWLKPEWVLQTYKSIDFPEVMHVTIWEEFLADKIAKHYGISSRKIVSLAYSFPRGRVTNVKPPKRAISLPSDDRGKWVFFHGNDAPGGIAKWQKKLVSEFSLAGMVGAMDWKIDDHEKQSPEEVMEMESLIGKIGKA